MIGIAITAILCTILGYGICAMMVIAKESDKAMARLYYIPAPRIRAEGKGE